MEGELKRTAVLLTIGKVFEPRASGFTHNIDIRSVVLVFKTNPREIACSFFKIGGPFKRKFLTFSGIFQFGVAGEPDRIERRPRLAKPRRLRRIGPVNTV